MIEFVLLYMPMSVMYVTICDIYEGSWMMEFVLLCMPMSVMDVTICDLYEGSWMIEFVLLCMPMSAMYVIYVPFIHMLKKGLNLPTDLRIQGNGHLSGVKNESWLAD